MATGLKQMVEEALDQQSEKPEVTPVHVSGEATAALAGLVREWSGWSNARLVLADPRTVGHGSAWASCQWDNRTFTANPETLVLNPHRVLLTITPFRLRQEAVLTGALLHEAGHARHSLWIPCTTEQVSGFRHSNGDIPNVKTVEFARLMEEPRIDGIMARDADSVGARGLGWTMRAASAHLLPGTVLSADPNQKIMDLVTAWALRAGRQIAFNHHTGHTLRHWVGDFTSLLHQTIEAHLLGVMDDQIDAPAATREIMDLILDMIRCEDDRGSTMIDKARQVLELLFPETDEDDQPSPGAGCQSEHGQPDESDESDESEEGEQGEGDEAGEGGEGDTEPEDDGSGDEPGDGDTGDDGEEEGESDSEGESGQEEGATDSTDPSTDTESELAQMLADIEANAKSDTEEECDEEAQQVQPADGAGTGGVGADGEEWRNPTPTERGIQKGAERFLRTIIAPSEASKIMLTDSPSATVDGAALSAWKAGGQVRTPHFFKRTHREIEPSPPVKIAVLVDVSGSMEELQTPSAVLSWALASAALDLRNFAGRGQQVESTLIHWGSTARVIQHNGEMLPGIREVGCYEGTSALHEAMELVESELPGFYDEGVTENRLIVHFTDWELSGWTKRVSAEWIHKALAAGVNMITVAPRDYSERRSDLADIVAGAKVQRGTSSIMRYDERHPEQVWENAAAALA